jgi:hypothetical protein
MFVKTDMSFGVNEVLLASVLGSVVFSVAAAQPLVIVGVTGPITGKMSMKAIEDTKTNHKQSSTTQCTTL